MCTLYQTILISLCYVLFCFFIISFHSFVEWSIRIGYVNRVEFFDCCTNKIDSFQSCKLIQSYRMFSLYCPPFFSIYFPHSLHWIAMAYTIKSMYVNIRKTRKMLTKSECKKKINIWKSNNYSYFRYILMHYFILFKNNRTTRNT